MTTLGRYGALFLLLLLASCGSDSASPTPPIASATTLNTSLCERTESGINWQALQHTRCPRLSQYRLFGGAPNVVGNSNGGMHYQLNSELFSDYARKYRYFYLPEGSHIGYQDQATLDFPLGTVLVKVFALPDISTDDPSERIIEIRLLIHRANGWVFIPYVWDDALQDGRLSLGGSNTPVSFQQEGNLLEFTYESPSQLRCENCHQVLLDKNLSFLPIGPKIRHLNRSVEVDGVAVNQLQYWQTLGLITLPAGELPFAPDWRDSTQPLQDRAKAYLDINCAHCHNQEGAAALSGLRLEYGRTSIDYAHGVCNSAHGWRGGGFDIWPGRGADSSLPLRMELNGATDRMPPIGRAVADEEAVALIRAWIDSLPAKECVSG